MDEIITEETNEVIEESSPSNEHPYDLPGQWYVLNAQSGHEKKVKDNLLTRVKNLHLEDQIYDVYIPTEEVIEIRNSKKVTIEKKTFPGYVLVRMDDDDNLLYEIRNTPSVIELARSIFALRCSSSCSSAIFEGLLRESLNDIKSELL